MKLNKPSLSVKVIGVGGGGCQMAGRTKGKCGHMPGIEFVAIDTHFPRFKYWGDDEFTTIQLGPIEQFDGDSAPVVKAAGDPSFISRLREAIGEADLVVIVVGMGGTIGTAVSPLVARIAKGAGALVLAFVTTPYSAFSSEGVKRNRAAKEGIRHLRAEVHNMVVVSNDCLLRNRNYGCTVESFAHPDSTISRGIASLMEPVLVPGEVNINPGDFRRVMTIPGSAVMCMGTSRPYTNSALDAAMKALENPLVEIPVTGAKGVLISFWGNNKVATNEYREALEFLQHEVNPHADWIFGIAEPEGLRDYVSVTLIATGIGPPPRWSGP